MFVRYFRSPLLIVLLAAGVMSITLPGGCPAPQTPQQPSNEEPTDEQPQDSTDFPGFDSDESERPVVFPDQGEDDTDGDQDDGTGGEDGTGGDTPATEPDFVQTGNSFLRMAEPSVARVTRPTSTVEIEFFLNYASDVEVTSAQVIAARDDDADGKPDGGAVYQAATTVDRQDNTIPFALSQLDSLLVNQFGQFVLGIRVELSSTEVLEGYAPGTTTIDADAPTATWIEPTNDALRNRSGSWTVKVETDDVSSTHKLIVLLDRDTVPENGNEVEFGRETFDPGTAVREFQANLAAMPVGEFYYYVSVDDGLEAGATAPFYATDAQGDLLRIVLTDRLIASSAEPFITSTLTDDANPFGAVLQGANFNDLAGSSISKVPDINGDSIDELIIGARFGKPYFIQSNGVGFGEAYLIYGKGERLYGDFQLNSVGNPDDPNSPEGLLFPGIRTPLDAPGYTNSVRWTHGLSDITVVPDMDGDDLPELVFSFPRVESINIGETDPAIQHPDLIPDIPGIGTMEYNAYYMGALAPEWHPDESQFTRGGVVIVSSHNELLQYPTLRDRKSNRVLDLHEVGQMFDAMYRPSLVPYIESVIPPSAAANPPTTPDVVCADCNNAPPDNAEAGAAGGPGGDPPPQPGTCGDDGCSGDTGGSGSLRDGREALIERWVCQWDVVFDNQGPGGFHMPWTEVVADPPLASPGYFPFNTVVPDTPLPFSSYPNHWVADKNALTSPPYNTFEDACTTAGGCEVTNEWYVWSNIYQTGTPGTTLTGMPSWAASLGGGMSGGSPTQTLPDCYDNFPPPPEFFVTPPTTPCPAATGCGNPTSITVTAGATCMWTGFYPPGTRPLASTIAGQQVLTPIGARILGQRLGDRFGTAVSSDGTWLYMSAPRRSANQQYQASSTAGDEIPDVPGLSGVRERSGVIYGLRTNAPLETGGPTRTQLWLERRVVDLGDGSFTYVPMSWPNVDAEMDGTDGRPLRVDYTMPVPHQYIIESVGSLRGSPDIGPFNGALETTCPPPYTPAETGQPKATAVFGFNYPTGTSGDYIDRVWQVVGPHDDAKLSFVRALGDINDDGVRDFAVGSPDIKQTTVSPPGLPGQPPTVLFNGPVVGSIFIVYGRPPGTPGDRLLEQLAKDPVLDPDRLDGVLLQGTSAGEKLARVFDNANDFNGDGIDDVVIGNEAVDYQGTEVDSGEAIVLLGSASLVSPAGGWTVPQAVAEGRAIRFFSSTAGDMVGANVAGIGNVDGDWDDVNNNGMRDAGEAELYDILIAAPGVDYDLDASGTIDPDEVDVGAVYLIYGSPNLSGDIDLADIGTFDLPGVKFIGRTGGDQLGGGWKDVSDVDPHGGSVTAHSRGVSRLGDIDGDGYDDYAIGAMMADVNGRTDAGEVYIIYGRGNQ